MKTPLWLVLLFAVGAAASSDALETPQPSPWDSCVKAVFYNGDNVVQVDAVLGIATHIVLEEGEGIVAHAFGDSEAYEFEATKHHVFIKPKAEGADTNLVIVTDKRSYKFRLVFKETRDGATYELLFRYRDTRAKAEQKALAKAAVEEGFSEVLATNLNYTMSGDLDLAPVNASKPRVQLSIEMSNAPLPRSWDREHTVPFSVSPSTAVMREFAGLT